ncbi:putative cytokinetic ring protein SteA [Brevibacillus massiliensis]|uniref:putative cytokinetic ring protein SteA n=1 Tax=Brevibacillus massiliensis TaxID=1118054 RepID=UPI0002ED70B7|nr:putative cytokinetic ring protein SteA [Brevibacillus massiliensis]
MVKRKFAFSLPTEVELIAGSKTKQLCKRIQPGQVAVVHHENLDEMAAEALLQARVGAVINTASYMTGSYPAMGARRLLEGHVPLYEATGSESVRLLELPEGTLARLANDRLYVKGDGEWQPFCPLHPISKEEVEEKWQIAQSRLPLMLSQFIDNTLTYASREKELFLQPLAKLALQTDMAHRHVVVVVRGKHTREDLRLLRTYIQDRRPILLAVDGGADVLLENGYRPDLIVGDMDSVTDEALACGAEIVVHAYVDGRAPGKERIDGLGIPCHVLPAPGTSEDVAMLLAYEHQAELIVTIGTHTNMIDFLEKGRKGMGSTLLVRTKIGARLIDAKGVSRLYQPRMSWHALTFFAAAALVPIVALFAVNPVTRRAAQMVWKHWQLLTS